MSGWTCLRCMQIHEIVDGKVQCDALPLKAPTQEDWIAIKKWWSSLKDAEIDDAQPRR